MAHRVLLIGFSVTYASPGYATRLKDRMAAAALGVEMHICGLGGLNSALLPTLLDDVLLRHGPFSHVVFEVATSALSYNYRSAVDDFVDPIYDLIGRAQGHGASVAFLNLYRRENDYARDIFNMLTESLGTRHGIPVWDLARRMATMGPAFMEAAYRDVTHMTPLGADFYAWEIEPLMRAWLSSAALQEQVPAPKRHLRSVRFASLPALQDRVKAFESRGFNADCVTVREDEKIEIVTPAPIKPHALVFLAGPLSGDVDILFNGQNAKASIGVYDPWCYYERVNASRLASPLTDTFRFHVKPGMPDVELVKGEKKYGQRETRLLELQFYE